MVEVCVNGDIFYEADTSYELLLNVLQDSFVSPSTYISLNLSVGGRVAVKKESITAIAEIRTNQDA